MIQEILLGKARSDAIRFCNKAIKKRYRKEFVSQLLVGPYFGRTIFPSIGFLPVGKDVIIIGLGAHFFAADQLGKTVIASVFSSVRINVEELDDAFETLQ